MSEAIFRVKLYEDVANRIQERICAEQWRSGDRLPAESALAREFDVSRSTVREAVRSLQLAGILRSRAGSGTYVSENAPMLLRTKELAQIMSDPDHLHDLVRARYLLEPQLAALAADKASPEEKQNLVSMALQMGQETDRLGLMTQGYAFHMELATMSHNEVLLGFYRSAASQMRSMRILESLTLEVYLQGVQDHLRIAEAVLAGDGSLARRTMEAHLKKDYLDYLND